MNHARKAHLAALLLTSLAVGACESSKNADQADRSSNSAAPSDNSEPAKALTPEEVIAEAKATVKLAYEGSFSNPPAEGPEATPDKNLWVVTCADIIESCSVPGRHAEAAAKEMGWDVTYAEGALQATVAGDRIRSAIASNADAIILVGIDCPGVQAPLQAAKDAGIEIVGIYSFDCDDPTFGGSALFAASARASVGGETNRDQQTEWGRIKGAWTIADSNGTAKVIQLNSNDRLVIRYTGLGFEEALARCSDCEIVGRVDATDSEILQILPALQKGNSAAAANPDATYAHSPIDSILGILVLPVLTQNNMDDTVKIVGGEGLDSNMQLIRDGKQAMALAYPHEWMAWSAVDIVNRIFAKADISVNQGISWQLVDKDHNLPESGPYVPPIDFKKYYRAVWAGESVE